jgi:hypothetical protein
VPVLECDKGRGRAEGAAAPNLGEVEVDVGERDRRQDVEGELAHGRQVPSRDDGEAVVVEPARVEADEEVEDDFDLGGRRPVGRERAVNGGPGRRQ